MIEKTCLFFQLLLEKQRASVIPIVTLFVFENRTSLFIRSSEHLGSGICGRDTSPLPPNVKYYSDFLIYDYDVTSLIEINESGHLQRRF